MSDATELTLKELGVHNRLDLRCTARRIYKGEYLEEDCSSSLTDYYPKIEESIKKLLEAIAQRIDREGDYVEFEIVFRPSVSGRTMRDAAMSRIGG